jgi:hypothetical protein
VNGYVQEAVPKENWMPEQEEMTAATDAAGSEVSAVEPDEHVMRETVSEVDDSSVLTTAIARPGTVLETLPKGKMSKFTVSLLPDTAAVPSLDEIERINQSGRGDARTPVMTVIQAIVAKHGGSMLLEDLAAEIGKHWNRPLPTTPYSLLEFVYVIVRGSDNLRVG